MAEDKICDVCKRNTCGIMGLEFDLTIKDEDGKSPEEADYVLKLFGKLNFAICFTCWLLSLGVKGKKGLVEKHLKGTEQCQKTQQ